MMEPRSTSTFIKLFRSRVSSLIQNKAFHTEFTSKVVSIETLKELGDIVPLEIDYTTRIRNNVNIAFLTYLDCQDAFCTLFLHLDSVNFLSICSCHFFKENQIHFSL